MKPSRKALARPGPHQRQRDGGEGLPAVGAQGLRRLLHRRADALDHADQDQERDRREGQHLREPDPGQAVDPARRPGCRRARARNWVTAPERPNSRITASPITNGGVMIGSTVSTRSARLAGKSVRVAISAKASPSSVVPAPTRTAEQQRVPGDAAADPAVQAGEPPDLAVRAAWPGSSPGAKLAGVVLRPRWSGSAVTGKKMKTATSATISADRADHEHVAVDRAARRDAPGQKEQEGGADQEPAIAHAELAVVERPEQALEHARTASRGCRSRSPAART